jgi:uncharacterized protein
MIKNMDINRIKIKIKKSEPFLKEEFKVKKIGVFGSYLRNEQRKGSDVDILVEFFEDPSLFKFLRLEEFLSKMLDLKVDLVMKNSLKSFIGKCIKEEVMYL